MTSVSKFDYDYAHLTMGKNAIIVDFFTNEAPQLEEEKLDEPLNEPLDAKPTKFPMTFGSTAGTPTPVAFIANINQQILDILNGHGWNLLPNVPLPFATLDSLELDMTHNEADQSPYINFILSGGLNDRFLDYIYDNKNGKETPTLGFSFDIIIEEPMPTIIFGIDAVTGTYEIYDENDSELKIGEFELSHTGNVLKVKISFDDTLIYGGEYENVIFGAKFNGVLNKNTYPGDVTNVEREYIDEEGWHLTWDYDNDAPIINEEYEITKKAIQKVNGENGTTKPYTTPYIDYTIVATVKEDEKGDLGDGDLRDKSIVDVLSSGLNDLSDLDLELTGFSYKIYIDGNDTDGSHSESGTITIDDNNQDTYLTGGTFTFEIGDHLGSIPGNAVITKVELTLHTQLTPEAYQLALDNADVTPGAGTNATVVTFTGNVKNGAELIYNGDYDEPITTSGNIDSEIEFAVFSKNGTKSAGDTIAWSLKGYTQYIWDNNAVYIVDYISDNAKHDYARTGTVLDPLKISLNGGATSTISLTEFTGSTISLPNSSGLNDVATVRLAFEQASGSSDSGAVYYKKGTESIVIIKLDNPDEVNNQFEITYSTRLGSAYTGTSVPDSANFGNNAYLYIDEWGDGGPGWGTKPFPEGGINKDVTVAFTYAKKRDEIYNPSPSRRLKWVIDINKGQNIAVNDFTIVDTIDLNTQKFATLLGVGGDNASARAQNFTDGNKYGITKTGGKLKFNNSGALYDSDPTSYVGWYQYTAVGETGTLTIYLKRIEQNEVQSIEVETEFVVLSSLEQQGLKTNVTNNMTYTGTGDDGSSVTGGSSPGLNGYVTYIKKAAAGNTYNNGSTGSTIRWDITINESNLKLKDVVITDYLDPGLRLYPLDFRLGASTTLELVTSVLNGDNHTYTYTYKTTSNEIIKVTEYYHNAELGDDKEYYYYKIDLTGLGTITTSKVVGIYTFVDYTKYPFDYDYQTQTLVYNYCYLDGEFYAESDIPGRADWHIIDENAKKDLSENTMTPRQIYDSIRTTKAKTLAGVNRKPAKSGVGEDTIIDGSKVAQIKWTSLVAISHDWNPTSSNKVEIIDTIVNENLIIAPNSVKVYIANISDARYKHLSDILLATPKLYSEGLDITNDVTIIYDYDAAYPPTTAYTYPDKGFVIDLSDLLNSKDPVDIRGKVLLITYETLIDAESSDVFFGKDQVINKIKIRYNGVETKALEGEGKTTMDYKPSASAYGSASVMPRINITKVSSSDHTTKIDDVIFTLKAYTITKNGDVGTIDTSVIPTPTPATTKDGGNAVFGRLKKGFLYVLTEVDAPDDYTMLSKPIYIVIDEDGITQIIDNNSGTDGIGTISDNALITLTKGDKYTYTITASGAITREKEDKSGNKYDITFIIENDPKSTGGPKFPLTGGIGRETTATIGIGLLLTSALASTVILAPNRKKDKDAESKLPKSRKRK